MLGIFSGAESEEEGEDTTTLSKSILGPDERERYEKQYEEVRENLQSLNTSVKMNSNADGFSIPSAGHDYSDLEDLVTTLERVEEDLRQSHDIVMITDKVWMARYCIHQIRSLQDYIDIEAEVQDD